MSRILRRPMFRGGPVSSYGTGIASGLADGGRVGFDNGGWLPNAGPLPMKLGADLGQFKKVNRVNNIAPFGRIIEEKEEETTEMFPTLTGMSFPKDAETMVEMEMGEPSINTWDEYIPVPERTIRGVPTGGGVKLNPNYEPPTRTVKVGRDETEIQVPLNEAELAERAEAKERAQGYLPDSGPAPMKGITQINNTPVVVNPDTGNPDDPNDPANQPESTAISADDIRAQAALFDELLNEGFEKDKRSAQIGDASDYLLKYSENVGKTGDWKKAFTETAGWIADKPSKTEAVKAGQKKTKQTATVMAINEALASNKSDRELDKMFAKMGLDEQMRKRLLVERINLETAVARGMSIRKRVNADKSSGTSDMNKLRNHTKGFAEDFEKTNELPTGSVEVTSFLTEKKEGSKLPLYTDKKVLLVEENKNQIFIDEATKRVYQVVEDTNGNLTFKTLAQ